MDGDTTDERPPSIPEVEADPRTIEFIREHGGAVFLWVDGAGMKHVKLDRPEGRSEFVALRGTGFALFVDPTIYPPRSWKVVLRHLPHRYVDVLYNGSVGLHGGYIR